MELNAMKMLTNHNSPGCLSVEGVACASFALTGNSFFARVVHGTEWGWSVSSFFQWSSELNTSFHPALLLFVVSFKLDFCDLHEAK